MAYAIAYCIHTLEMSALRGWGVAFLGYVAVTTGGSTAAVLSPAIVATGLGLIGTFASVVGNEAAIRFGRKRLVMTAMLASILIGGTIGFIGSTSYALAVVLITLYGVVIWLTRHPSRREQRARRSPRGAGPRSPCTRCSAMRAVLSAPC